MHNMGEQASRIGKKLEGFGENLFSDFGWTELARDKEIKCTRTSHKKKTHGIDLLFKNSNALNMFCLRTLSTGSSILWLVSISTNLL